MINSSSYCCAASLRRWSFIDNVCSVKITQKVRVLDLVSISVDAWFLDDFTIMLVPRGLHRVYICETSGEMNMQGRIVGSIPYPASYPFNWLYSSHQGLCGLSGDHRVFVLLFIGHTSEGVLSRPAPYG